MKWLRTVLFAFVAIVAASAARADIAIGIAGPMTGAFAVFGEQMRQGAEQAIADINEAGGVLGEKLVLEVADDDCDGKQAAAVANQMVGRGIVMMAGHFCSIASIQAAPVYASQKIVQISPSSPAPRFTEERAGPGVFRLGGRDDEQGKIAGAYLAKNFADRNIAIVDDRSVYGKTLADETRKAMNAAGKTETMSESYSPGDREFSELVARFRDARIGVVFIGGYHTEAGLIAREIGEQGLEVAIVGGDALLTQEYWESSAGAAGGTLATFAPDPRKDKANAALVKRFRTKGIEPEGYVVPTYAAIELWKGAVQAAGTTDFDAVVAALATRKFATPLGEVSFNEKGDSSLPGYVFYRWSDGFYDYPGDAM
jgi:branched-chain amino acid transport system substrate-binding protein